MSNTAKIEVYPLYRNSWVIRQSDPGEEGARNHLFNTIYVHLDALYNNTALQFHYQRKLEDNIEFSQTFDDLESLFKFLGGSLDPISLGLLGVKIGKLLSQLKIQ